MCYYNLGVLRSSQANLGHEPGFFHIFPVQLWSIWGFPKIEVPLVIIHFQMGFSLINHPFWVPPFQETPIFIVTAYNWNFQGVAHETTKKKNSRIASASQKGAVTLEAVDPGMLGGFQSIGVAGQPLFLHEEITNHKLGQPDFLKRKPSVLYGLNGKQRSSGQFK